VKQRWITVASPGEPVTKTGWYELADGTHVTSYRGDSGTLYQAHEAVGRPVCWYKLAEV
jgi:hypothetical protein